MDKVIIITGSSGGIGREAARIFFKAGYSLVINGRSPDKLNQLAAELSSPRVLALQGDASKGEDIQRLVKECINYFGKLDGLILNAGHSMRGRLAESSEKVWEQMTRSNLIGPALLVRESLPYLRESQGKILFISTQAGLFGLPGILPYGAAKGGLQILAEGLRLEEPEITTSIFYPGFTENDPDKKIMDHQGNWISHNRKARFTQEDAAQEVFKAFQGRRLTYVMGSQGKVLNFFSRIAPSLVRLFIHPNSTQIQTRANGDV